MRIKLIYIVIFVIGLVGWRVFSQIRIDYLSYSEKDYKGIYKQLDVDSGIVAVLIPNKKYYRIGEMPDMNLILINRTDSVIYLPGALDGSPNMTRLPFCDFEVLNRSVNHKGWIDAMPNPLINEDLVRLEPTESFNAFDKKIILIKDHGYDSLFMRQDISTDLHNFWSPFNFGHKRIIWPGKYDIKVIYSTMNDTSIFKGWNPDDYDFNYKYLDSIPETRVESNTVTIRYSIF